VAAGFGAAGTFGTEGREAGGGSEGASLASSTLGGSTIASVLLAADGMGRATKGASARSVADWGSAIIIPEKSTATITIKVMAAASARAASSFKEVMGEATCSAYQQWAFSRTIKLRAFLVLVPFRNAKAGA
jgi:hypothetical protein